MAFCALEECGITESFLCSLDKRIPICWIHEDFEGTEPLTAAGALAFVLACNTGL